MLGGNKRSRSSRVGAWLGAQSIPQALATRARVVLGSAAGESVRGLAARLGVTQTTVCLWRRRYRSAGLDGLRTKPRMGRPRRITSAKEQAVISATLRKPKAATHWSARRLAKQVGLSPATVHRIWQKYGLQPHRVETFKFSCDPQFDAKLADIVGLYLDPPERALVLCVDEKSQIQALNRTQPALPMWPGLPVRMTHDYVRHGTTSLFAALEVASGKVHGRCYRRHHDWAGGKGSACERGDASLLRAARAGSQAAPRCPLRRTGASPANLDLTLLRTTFKFGS